MMADFLQVLGQVNPSSGSLTDVYTVPALTQATVSSLTVANYGTSEGEFRVAVAVSGSVDDSKQYIYWDVPVPSNNTFSAVIGLTLNTTDVIRVYANVDTLAFNFFGVQVT